MALGLSQGQLADRLAELGGDTITRECVSRWERGKRTPGRYWLPHLAAALEVPARVLEAENVRRRELLRLAATAPLLLRGDDVPELVASIAAGDETPLAGVQTTHLADLAVAQLATADRACVLHLARWMTDGGTDVLRVNAAGILAKTRHLDQLDAVALRLRHDGGARTRYVHALDARVGRAVPALAAEVVNPRDAGARWCAAWLLGQDGSPAARAVLLQALRRDPVLENVRTIGLMLNGENPCT